MINATHRVDKIKKIEQSSGQSKINKILGGN